MENITRQPPAANLPAVGWRFGTPHKSASPSITVDEVVLPGQSTLGIKKGRCGETANMLTKSVAITLKAQGRNPFRLNQSHLVHEA